MIKRRIVAWIGGVICRLFHDNLSIVFYRPAGWIGALGGPERAAYRVCLDCGTEFAYDTKKMKLGRLLTNQTQHKRTLLQQEREDVA